MVSKYDAGSGGSIDPRIKQDMAKKLGAFERLAKKAARQVSVAAKTDNTLFEALHTKHAELPKNYLTETGQPPATVLTAGMQIGGFAVFAMPNENGKTRYDVVNMTTQQKIVGGLHLAEGANTMVKLMNKGYSFYSPQIKNLLDLENSYVKHYQDAISFSRKVKNSPSKDAVLETRFEESKLKASEVKQKLLEYIKKI